MDQHSTQFLRLTGFLISSYLLAFCLPHCACALSHTFLHLLLNHMYTITLGDRHKASLVSQIFSHLSTMTNFYCNASFLGIVLAPFKNLYPFFQTCPPSLFEFFFIAPCNSIILMFIVYCSSIEEEGWGCGVIALKSVLSKYFLIDKIFKKIFKSNH